MLHSSKFRNKTTSGAPILFGEAGSQNKGHNKTMRNINAGSKMIPFDGSQNHQFFLQNLERTAGTQDGASDQ